MLNYLQQMVLLNKMTCLNNLFWILFSILEISNFTFSFTYNFIQKSNNITNQSTFCGLFHVFQISQHKLKLKLMILETFTFIPSCLFNLLYKAALYPWNNYKIFFTLNLFWLGEKFFRVFVYKETKIFLL